MNTQDHKQLIACHADNIHSRISKVIIANLTNKHPEIGPLLSKIRHDVKEIDRLSKELQAEDMG